MSLNATDLKTELISALDGIDNATDAHDAFATALLTHIKDNAEIAGVYVGVIGASSDPLSGSYTWEIASADDITGDDLYKENGEPIETLSDWETNTQMALASITLELNDNGSVPAEIITIAGQPAMTIGTLDIDMSSLPDTQTSAMDIVATKIINAITGTVFTSIPNATSAGGGTGTVTFSGIS